MGYPYLRDAPSTSPLRRPPFSSADQTGNKYQARRTNIPGQHNNYSNVIQNCPLQDQQCFPPTYQRWSHPQYTYTTHLHAQHIPLIRVNTMMTNICTLPRSGNSLFELPKQHFADQPVKSTPVIINAANDNLPVHFINHSDRDVVVPKHTSVGAMEKVQESGRDNFSTNAQVSSDTVLLISPVPQLYNITLTLVMLNPSSKDSTSSNLLNWKLTLKLTPSKQDRHCIRRIPIICRVPIPPL